MNGTRRKKVIATFSAMSVAVIVFSYLVEHVLLGLPLWFVAILTVLAEAAVTVGTMLAIRNKRDTA